MISRYDAILNGISLSRISADILILDIGYQAPSLQDTTFTVAKRHGARTFRRYFDPAVVTISFEIHSYSIRQRQAIRNAVCTWAKDGGTLKTNDRDGQFLQCVCSGFPSVESVRNWTDPLTIEFTAYVVPFWQETVPKTVSLSGTSGSADVWVPGSVDGAFVEANVKANDALTNVMLAVNGRELTLSSISVASGRTIVISYDTDGIQSIKVRSTSLLNKRTGVDDLLANCGASNNFAFVSDASVDVTFSVRGWWL